ncbi:MAG TPA: hypothetical protein VE993_00030 [Stellaceae bacterium]|nr:hypothetical protein [Stellaceae bacterium]
MTAVAPRGEAETRAALDQLIGTGLVFQRGTPPAAEYQFKHALVQDTAYGTLLRGPRQALHARIAETLATSDPARVEREPELLAHPLAEAGQHGEAVLYWQRAGELAVRRAANREAISHFRRASRSPGGLTTRRPWQIRCGAHARPSSISTMSQR